MKTSDLSTELRMYRALDSGYRMFLLVLTDIHAAPEQHTHSTSADLFFSSVQQEAQLIIGDVIQEAGVSPLHLSCIRTQKVGDDVERRCSRVQGCLALLGGDLLLPAAPEWEGPVVIRVRTITLEGR